MTTQEYDEMLLKRKRMDEYEANLIEIIQVIQEQFQKAAEPYVKKLAEIRLLKPVIITDHDLTKLIYEAPIDKPNGASL